MGYSTNGTALNGIMGNPNGLGITLVLGLAIFLVSSKNKLNICLSFILIFLTNSRTSIITALVILGYYIIVLNIKRLSVKTKKVNLNLSITLFTIVALVLYVVILYFKNTYISIKREKTEN